MTQPPPQNDPYGYQPPADPYSGPVSGDPTYGQQYPTAQYPPAPQYPGQYPPPYQYGQPQPEPRKRRTGTIVALVAVLAVVLCGGGAAAAFLLVENNKPKGQASEEAAVAGFLTAVFTHHDADEAADYVCEGARDADDLNALVTSVSAFEKDFPEPKTTWKDPDVESTGKDQAAATVKLTFATGDERAADKQIRLLLVRDRGWWVCDVEPA